MFVLGSSLKDFDVYFPTAWEVDFLHVSACGGFPMPLMPKYWYEEALRQHRVKNGAGE